MADGMAKKLARTVVRAFYDDDAIVCIDALTRNNYLKDHEGSRGPLEEKFGIQAKQIRRTLQLLYDHCLIEKDTVRYKELDAAKYTRAKVQTFWYINYLHFVKIVRLRLHFMVKEIEILEATASMSDHMYFCPQCSSEFDTLIAVSCTDEDTQKFFCQNCYRNLDEKIWLKEIEVDPDKGKATGKTKPLKQKRNEQINELRGCHDGIMEILQAIDRYPLAPSTNLPREHHKNAEIDKEEREHLAQNAPANSSSMATWKDRTGRSVQVSIASLGGGGGEEKQAKKEKTNSLPAWMQLDVSGKKSANALQDEKERAAKRQRGGVTATTAANLARGGAADLLDAKPVKKANPINARRLKKSRSELELLKARYALEETIFVSVGGVEKKLREITKQDEDTMTDEEYDEYFRAKRATAKLNQEDEEEDVIFV